MRAVAEPLHNGDAQPLVGVHGIARGRAGEGKRRGTHHVLDARRAREGAHAAADVEDLGVVPRVDEATWFLFAAARVWLRTLRALALFLVLFMAQVRVLVLVLARVRVRVRVLERRDALEARVSHAPVSILRDAVLNHASRSVATRREGPRSITQPRSGERTSCAFGA